MIDLDMAGLGEAKLDSSWREVLGAEFNKSYMSELGQFLARQKDEGKVIYPPSSEWFAAFNSTAFNQVRVVILGQDPYHGPDQAHGLCFSVPLGVKLPPSLLNIHKELESDLGFAKPSHGCLSHWAEQGVLLLNATLTVEQACPGAHQGRGWEQFTDRAIEALNDHRDGIVFILWGSYAQKKGAFIDQSRHLVLRSAHPSPLSAYRGFLGCKHFSEANSYLTTNTQMPIEWQLPDSQEADINFQIDKTNVNK